MSEESLSDILRKQERSYLGEKVRSSATQAILVGEEVHSAVGYAMTGWSKPVPDFMKEFMQKLPYHQLIELSVWADSVTDPIDKLIEAGI